MSDKVHVFEALFQERYDRETKAIIRPLVSLDDVAASIRYLSEQGTVSLSAKNPANFMKDYLRSARRNELWPSVILEAGFTARQRTTDGQCFEFVPLARPGEEPFPDEFLPDGTEPVFVMQTLSLPVATREIVRVDEQSVAQISVKLNILEHLLAASPDAVKFGVIQITHLQNNVKLRDSEIDALYQIVVSRDGKIQTGALAVEVKLGDPIISEQIEDQAWAILRDPSFDFCIPAIVRRMRKGELIAMHLSPLMREEVDEKGKIVLRKAFTARYVFEPPLPKL